MHVSCTISVHYYCLAKIILQQTITFILTILDLHQIYILIVTNQTMENFLIYQRAKAWNNLPDDLVKEIKII